MRVVCQADTSSNVACSGGVGGWPGEQLSAAGDMSGQDREGLAIDVQDGQAVGQEVPRPIPREASARADMDAPLRISRDPDGAARRPTALAAERRQVNL